MIIKPQNKNKNEKVIETSVENLKSKFGGYWRFDFLDFHYLYNPYFPSEYIIEKIREDLPALIDFYPSTQRVIAEILSRIKYEAWFNEENLIVGNGSSELIRILNEIMNDVLLPVPCFNEYTQIDEGKITYYRTKKEDNYFINTSGLLDFINNGLFSYLVLNNPNNPTGQLIPKNEIRKFLDTGIKVVVDEAFIDWSGKDNSCEDMVEEYNNLIIIKSLTKTTGCGGLRVGYILTKNEKIKKLVRSKLPIWNINSIAERYLELLLEQTEEFRESIIKVLRDKSILFKDLSECKIIEPIVSDGNFIFCKTSISSKLIEKELFKENKIMIKAGINQCGILDDNYIRVGIRTLDDNEKLIKALKAIELRYGEYE